MKAISFLIFSICLVWLLKMYYDKHVKHTRRTTNYSYWRNILLGIGLLVLIVGMNLPSNHKDKTKIKPKPPMPITYTAVGGTSVNNSNDDGSYVLSKNFNKNGHAQFNLHTHKDTRIMNISNNGTHGFSLDKIKTDYYHVNFSYNPSNDNGRGYKYEIATGSPHHRLNYINFQLNDNGDEQKSYQQKKQRQRAKQIEAAKRSERIQAQKRQHFYDEAIAITGKSWNTLKRKYPALSPTEDLEGGTYMSLSDSTDIDRIHGTVVDVSSYGNQTQLLVSINNLDHLMYIRTGSDNARYDETRWSHNIHTGDRIVAFGDNFYKNEKVNNKMIKQGLNKKYDGKTIYTLTSPEYILNVY